MSDNTITHDVLHHVPGGDRPAGAGHPPTPRLNFTLAPALEADAPAESNGGRRDGVRLMVSVGDEAPVHDRFRNLAHHLRAGDLLVVNTSATLPASLDAVTPNGVKVEVHLSTPLPSGLWLIELREPAQPASRPRFTDETGTTLHLAGGATIDVLTRFRGSPRLWVAVLHVPGDLLDFLGRHGHAIRYRHVPHEWPISAYQTVFADEPGSAEMPSAARALTTEIVTELVVRGIDVAPLVLHTGVSSLEGDERPYPERFRVPPTTAARVNGARARGDRVIAAGTTVVRALESAVDDDGLVQPRSGWTDAFITPARGVRVVDGLLTGWHEPEASHLLMLEAIAGRTALELAYRAAVDGGYRWHEFGDTHLILPADKRRDALPLSSPA
jgi:S-adenosylmethionine:tRNA ribosyltransferase-isomerase